MAIDETTSGHKTFLYEAIAEEIADLIIQGTYRPGERILSVRQLSRQRKISITTALQVYLTLENRGDRSAPAVRLLRALQASHQPARANVSTPSPDPTQVSVRELVMMVMKDTLNPISYNSARLSPIQTWWRPIR